MRRLGSIIPFLTILSLISISFAMWTINSPEPTIEHVSGEIVGDDVIHYNFIDGDSYQLFSKARQSEIKSFSYLYEGDGYVDGSPSSGKVKFTNKNVTIPIYANRTNLKDKLAYDDAGCYYIKFSLKYDVLVSGSDILIPTGKVKCYLQTVENIYFDFMGTFNQTTNTLDILIPIKSTIEYSIYNLITQDNKTTNNSKIPLNIQIEFDYKNSSKTEYSLSEFNSFLDVASTYSYSLSYTSKQ